ELDPTDIESATQTNSPVNSQTREIRLPGIHPPCLSDLSTYCAIFYHALFTILMLNMYCKCNVAASPSHPLTIRIAGDMGNFNRFLPEVHEPNVRYRLVAPTFGGNNHCE